MTNRSEDLAVVGANAKRVAVIHADGRETIMPVAVAAAAPALLDALRPFAAKDHGHTMSAPRESCPYCVARAALRLVDGAA